MLPLNNLTFRGVCISVCSCILGVNKFLKLTLTSNVGGPLLKVEYYPTLANKPSMPMALAFVCESQEHAVF